ncbi:MAG: peptidoglycan-binding protein [Deltaproteobacteria bacterium]|nr:peptidoglycan-binding protein [Deltaproteobacteria bacterium]
MLKAYCESEGEFAKRIRPFLSSFEEKDGSLEKDADGVFGAATDKAVREFQRGNGLTDDGHVGAETWAKLKKLISASQEKE